MNKKRNENDSLASIFGKKMAAMRKERQLSQQEFADQIGFSRSLVAYYEAWARNPSLDTIQKVADFFDVPAYEMLVDESKKSKKKETKLELQIQKIKLLSPHKQRMILNGLEAMLNSN